MPVIFRYQGIRFHFFSNEGTPREPIHIHASRPGAEAKIWIEPSPSLAKSMGFNRRELTQLLAVATEHTEEIKGAWHEHFGTNNSL